MDTEHGAVALPAASPSATSPMQLGVGVSHGQQSFTGWQGQAESYCVPCSVPVITGWDVSPLKWHAGS